MAKVALDVKRIQFLNDGIFGVAMTILVLQLNVPPGLSHDNLSAFLLSALLPHLLSVVVSFIILSAFWIDSHFHHHLILKTDKVSTWLNLIFLLFICLIPFSTGFLSRYYDDPLSMIMYSINLIGASFSHLLMLIYSWRNDFILSHISAVIYKNLKFRIILPVFIYTGIILLSLFFSNQWMFLLFLVPISFQIIFGRGKLEIEV